MDNYDGLTALNTFHRELVVTLLNASFYEKNDTFTTLLNGNPALYQLSIDAERAVNESREFISTDKDVSQGTKKLFKLYTAEIDTYNLYQQSLRNNNRNSIKYLKRLAIQVATTTLVVLIKRIGNMLK